MHALAGGQGQLGGGRKEAQGRSTATCNQPAIITHTFIVYPSFHTLVLQGTDYTTVCLDGERPTRMLLGASMDRNGSEWVSAHSLEVETLLVGAGGLRSVGLKRVGMCCSMSSKKRCLTTVP